MKVASQLAVLALVAAPFLGLGTVLAQSPPPEHSMTGCLAKGDDAQTFKLTNVQAGPKEVAIAESTANLAPHLGHKVEITGVAVPGKNNVHTMKVSAVKMLSATCP